jgi:hypothetical protein
MWERRQLPLIIWRFCAIATSDEYLVERGLPPMQLAAKIESIVRASIEIDTQPDRLAFAEQNLGTVDRLLKSYCDSAVAKNLQTAVDTAKRALL